ncbi:ABC-2 transporter permease [Anaerotruncus colihominis]|uniref:ABC-2 transporter permease n=1 Tax=Anaerotruncus colihominis TaxID=169435 RepID=A0A845RIV1_9FIRM|nr:ABC-2 transporter permease [Anaerotruncus colihominis]
MKLRCSRCSAMRPFMKNQPLRICSWHIHVRKELCTMSDILAVIRMNLLKLFNCGAEMILIVVILVCVIGYTSGISAVFVVFLYLLIYMAPAYDDQSHGAYLLHALPITRRQIVRAYYLYDLLALAAICLIGAVLARADAVQSASLLFLMGAVFVSVTQPLILYFGAVKARFAILLMYVVIFALSGIVGELLEIRVSGLPLTGAPAAVGAALLLFSYLVAQALYNRKEIAA